MTQFPRSFTTQITRTVGLNYLLYLPPGYGHDDAQWPLLMFLHGMGERGDDLELVKKHGPPMLIEQGQDFEFIVVSPQCPADSIWVVELDALTALLDAVKHEYAVDSRRIYLTGLSMGGYGTWHLAAEHPEQFAAIAPVCGGAMPFMGFPQKVCALKDVPVWCFHGAMDETVPIIESARLVHALRQCGGDVRFTIYPETGHDAWTEAYGNPELYRWFLQHTR